MHSSDTPVYLANLREATTTPSPVSEVLADPQLLRVLTRPMTPRRCSSRNSSKSRKPSSIEAPPELPLLSLVLNEEERQSSQLKMLLRSTIDRLDYEMVRAGAAERRSEHAEKTVKQASERFAQLITTQHQTELTVTRLTEEAKRYRMQLENTQAELERAQATIDDLEEDVRRVEREAREAREVVNKYERDIVERDAKELGRQEGMKQNGKRFVDGVIEGRREGYETAKRMERARQKQIYDTAFEAGRSEGFEEGNNKGRTYERRKAMEAFDKFLENAGYADDGKSVATKSGSVRQDWKRRDEDTLSKRS